MTGLPMTDAQIDALALQVKQELDELTPKRASSRQKGEAVAAVAAVPAKQLAAIEQAIGDSADSFWERYKRAACKDLCHEGGQLHRQWKEFSDLKSKDAVKVSVGIVAGLGIGGAALPVVAVAATVMLLNIVLNIGIHAICAGER